LRRRQRHPAGVGDRPDKVTALQPLAEQAHALPVIPEQLDQPATARFIVHPLVRFQEAG
jgi:hypothetical protein